MSQIQQSPHVAIICTAERLTLRDDATHFVFSVNLSTAIVADDPAAFVPGLDSAPVALLQLWEGHLPPNQPVPFDVFPILGGAIQAPVQGAAPQPGAQLNCRKALTDELNELFDKDLPSYDLSLLCWDPESPAVNTEARASSYQKFAWRHTVAHASTWPQPASQSLCLSFEVSVLIADLNGADSVLLFPRFSNGAVDTTATWQTHLETVLPNDPWSSYRAQYLNSAGVTTPRWGYQAPCLTQVKPSTGLVDLSTYWIRKDPAEAQYSTTDWRQNLESLILTRFDYLSRLLVLNQLPALGGQVIWKLATRMMQDLSDIGDKPGLEGNTLQYALLLRAFEALNGTSDLSNDASVKALIALIEKNPGDYATQIDALLKNADQPLWCAYRRYQDPGQKPDASCPQPKLPTDFSDTGTIVATLQSLYSALAKNDNLSTLLLAWWNGSDPKNLTLPAGISTQLSSTVLPAAQLHSRYLSAVAGRYSVSLQSALGAPPAGRSQHSAVLNSSSSSMIVFGGSPAATAAPLNDTWQLTYGAGNPAWNNLNPGGAVPALRRAHSAVFDAAASRMIVFGGQGATADLNDLACLSLLPNPVWTAPAATGNAPSQRRGHSAVYDPAHATMIVFGGGAGAPAALLNDTYVLTGANTDTPAWSRLNPTGNPPPLIFFHTAIYANSNRMIVFGGSDSTDGKGVHNDVWMLTYANGMGGTPAWVTVTPTGPLPPARANHTAVYDSASDAMIVFGGTGKTAGGLQPLNDIWMLSNASGSAGTPPAWSQIALQNSTQITQRQGHSAAYDVASKRMMVFSGGPAFVPDLWALTVASPASWSQWNPGGPAQLDAAIKNAVADWVHTCASDPALSLSTAQIAQIDALVQADLSQQPAKQGDPPVPAMSTVAPTDVVATKRPHPIVLSVGSWSTTGSQASDPNDELRRIAGVGLLIRKPSQPWRCLNAANLTVNYGGQQPLADLVFVPTRLQYRNGMKDPYLTFDNQPLIARSRVVDLQGQFRGGMGDWQPASPYRVGDIVEDPSRHRQQCTVAGTSGATPPKSWNDQGQTTQDGSVTWTDLGFWSGNLLAYGLPSGTKSRYAQFYGLTFGQDYEFAPFAIGHAGTVPKEIAAVLNGAQEIDFEDPYGTVIRKVSYRRRVPVGHIRVVAPPNPQSTPGPNQPMLWPLIPNDVYPLARDLSLTTGGASGSRLGTELPLILLPFATKASQSVQFSILPPATDIQTWDRWVADGTLYQAATNNTRKAVWAAFHRDSQSVTAGSDAQTNRIGDPAVSALFFQLESLDTSKPFWKPLAVYAVGDIVSERGGHSHACTQSGTSGAVEPIWNDNGQPTTESTGVTWSDLGVPWTVVQSYVSAVTYPPLPAGNPQDSTSAWATVSSSPIAVTASIAAGGAFTLATPDGGGSYSIAVPSGCIARLTVTPLVSAQAYTGRFEQGGIFNSLAYTDPLTGSQYFRVSVTGDTHGFVGLIESPVATSIDGDTLNSSLTATLENDRTISVGIGQLAEKLLDAGSFEIHRQDWRWLGRTIPDLASGKPAWAPGHSYMLGDIVADPAGNGQKCIVSGVSGQTSPEDWNEIGGVTFDGSVSWTNLGQWSQTNVDDWETINFGEEFGRPLNDFRISNRRFTLSGGDSQELLSVDLSKDPRCQYLRFRVTAHNRYENMPGFRYPASAASRLSPWKAVSVPRQALMPAPPKPLIRLVLPLTQRTSKDGPTRLFDLLVIADETWYQIGGLGETLVGQIQPVLGSKLATIDASLTVQFGQVDRFGGDAGVTYLGSGIALQKTDPPATGDYAAGQYSINASGPYPVYHFSHADEGANVAIAYLLLDPNGVQRSEYGTDQIVDGSAAPVAQPQMDCTPMGASLNDPALSVQNYSHTYFMGIVDPANLVSWNHFKVQFRRELRPFAGSVVQTLASAWTDPMWVQTIPDSATFKTQAGGVLHMSKIQPSWQPVAGGQSSVQLAEPIAPTSGNFQLWFVVTRQITDAFGNPAEVYEPAEGGSTDSPSITLTPGAQYNLHIVEVQTSPSWEKPPVGQEPAFDDTDFLRPLNTTDEMLRVVRIGPKIPIASA